MAEEDLYESKRKYLAVVEKLEEYMKPNKTRKYHTKNPKNIEYFKKLVKHFDAKDLSYIRRGRLIQTMQMIC